MYVKTVTLILKNNNKKGIVNTFLFKIKISETPIVRVVIIGL